MTHGPVDHLGITVGDGIQALVDRGKQQIVKLSFLRIGLEHPRAHHRHEGERGCGGHDHDEADDEAELTEHDSSHTGHHGQRQEHAEHGQCRSDDGDTHLTGSMHGGLLRILSPLNMSGNVLQCHDGIVHNHADRNGKRRH